MTDTIYLDVNAASEYLNKIGIPITTGGLANMRYLKRGPKYAKIAGRIRYKREWLDDYISSCAIAPPPPPRRLSARARL